MLYQLYKELKTPLAAKFTSLGIHGINQLAFFRPKQDFPRLGMAAAHAGLVFHILRPSVFLFDD
jgi:hypothetical protein